MITLADFRERYPQYANRSDGELARALHKKKAPQMEFGDFSKQIGYVDTERERRIQAMEADLRAYQAEARPKGRLEALIASAGRGMTELSSGAGQLAQAPLNLASSALGPEDGVGRLAAVASERLQNYSKGVERDAKAMGLIEEDFPITNFVGEVGGQMAVMPTGVASLGKALWHKIGVGILEGGAIGALQHTNEGESRLGNVAAGGLFGGMANGVAGGIQKRLNAKAGNMVNSGAQKTEDLAKKTGLDVGLTDTTREFGVMNRVDVLLEMLPFVGSQGARRKQLQTTKVALEKLRAKYAGMFADYGEDAAKAIQDGRANTLLTAQKTASQMFDDVGKLAEGKIVPTPKLNRQARDMLTKELSLGKKADQSVVGFLKRYITDDGLDFEGFRTVRSRMKSEIRDLAKGTEESRRLGDLIGAVEDDASAALSAISPKVKAMDDAARGWYKSNVVPLKHAFFKNIDDPTKMDGVMRSYLRQSSDNAKQLYNAVDDQGKAAMRFGLIDEAIQKATNAQDEISPTVFANKLKEFGKVADVIFPEDERAFIKGVQKLTSGMKGATRARDVAMTGMGASQIGAMGAGGAAAFTGMATNPLATGLTLGGAKLISWGMTTPGGRRLIQAAATANGSRMSEIIDGLRAIAVRYSAMETAGEEQDANL